VRTQGARIEFEDAMQGTLTQDVEREIGDFVVRRADGLTAYQLAVVVDDHAQGVTHVVRGADLLDSTPRQIHLQRLLGYTTPVYAHVPVAVNALGEKLSKQTHAKAVAATHAAHTWRVALRFLGQPAPDEFKQATPREIRDYASAHWRLAAVPALRAQPVT
jgi:glutamyl-Q tRNA(Asp) synthetase